MVLRATTHKLGDSRFPLSTCSEDQFDHFASGSVPATLPCRVGSACADLGAGIGAGNGKTDTTQDRNVLYIVSDVADPVRRERTILQYLFEHFHFLPRAS